MDPSGYQQQGSQAPQAVQWPSSRYQNIAPATHGHNAHAFYPTSGTSTERFSTSSSSSSGGGSGTGSQDSYPWSSPNSSTTNSISWSSSISAHSQSALFQDTLYEDPDSYADAASFLQHSQSGSTHPPPELWPWFPSTDEAAPSGSLSHDDVAQYQQVGAQNPACIDRPSRKHTSEDLETQWIRHRLHEKRQAKERLPCDVKGCTYSAPCGRRDNLNTHKGKGNCGPARSQTGWPRDAGGDVNRVDPLDDASLTTDEWFERFINPSPNQFVVDPSQGSGQVPED
ncbi:hypothetical protein QBC34DRAFT_492165 [Podospora aff. communis PSN243]|uniref:C2H2-type domain-containing protein n=1 Tax=Podospora aff. communis PSN243 TaxID=3040156 RepID=A0AAV9GY75_9PEZI|nr:hypothetical protein QBC34DRAFT_492165 [Podospora aff. communis PSN243]